LVAGFGCTTASDSGEVAASGGTSAKAGAPSGGVTNPSSAGGAAGRAAGGTGTAAGSPSLAGGSTAVGGTTSSASGGSSAPPSAGSGGTAGSSAGGTKAGGAGSGGTGGAGRSGGAAGNAASSGGTGTASGGNAGAGPAGNAGAPTAPVTIYLAADSTVSNYDTNHAPQAGWGQLLPENLIALAKVENRAVGGRSSRRFISEGRLDDILEEIEPNDYLMVQFGTNDGNKTAMYDDGMPYYVEPAEFEGYMEEYIAGARGKGAIPVLVTPPPRRSCDTADDSRPFGNGLGGYSTAMKNVAARTGCALVDLNQATLDYLNSIGCAASAQVFLVVPAGMYTGAYANGVSDGTHFQEFGARKLAGFVADGVRALELPLAAYLE